MAEDDLKNYKHQISWAGGKYVGELKYGVPEGHGKLIMPNGAAYDGGWLKGKPHGRGTIYYPGGSTYRGEVAVGKRHGYGGIYTGADGKVLKGVWENNKFVHKT